LESPSGVNGDGEHWQDWLSVGHSNDWKFVKVTGQIFKGGCRNNRTLESNDSGGHDSGWGFGEVKNMVDRQTMESVGLESE